MRRLFLAASAALLVTLTACGGSGTPTATAESGTAASPSSPASPSAAPSPSGPAVLAPADEMLCATNSTMYSKIFMDRALFSGFVQGIYKNAATGLKGSLADLKKHMAAYQTWLVSAAAKASDPGLKAALTSDAAQVAKELAALKAAGTDYKGKVYAVVGKMQSENPEDGKTSAICNP